MTHWGGGDADGLKRKKGRGKQREGKRTTATAKLVIFIVSLEASRKKPQQ